MAKLYRNRRIRTSIHEIGKRAYLTKTFEGFFYRNSTRWNSVLKIVDSKLLDGERGPWLPSIR